MAISEKLVRGIENTATSDSFLYRMRLNPWLHGVQPILPRSHLHKHAGETGVANEVSWEAREVGTSKEPGGPAKSQSPDCYG